VPLHQDGPKRNNAMRMRIAREYCPDDKFHDPITQHPVWLSCGTMDLALELFQATRYDPQLNNFALFKFEMGLAIRNSQAEVACKANQFCLTGGRRLVGQGASGVQDASIVLIPFNFSGNHWTLAAAYPSTHKVVYWDPMG
ncbi:hypothetical protein HaLaN_32343, partial [Haematococcus lacustris]